MNKKELEAISNFVIIQDSREQTGYKFDGMIIRKLEFGDYSFEYEGKSYENEIVVERKSCLSEAYGFSGKERDRFTRELERMKDVKHKYLLFEYNYLDIATFDYAVVKPTTVMATIWSYCVKYQIAPLFCGNRVNARACLYKLFQFYVKYEILKMDKMEDL